MIRLEQQMSFILEADKLKEVGRQNYISGAGRKENSAEHSWHLALMCLLLREYANEKIDVLKVITMVLVHDLVEIDAGDTYAYDEAANCSKREREVAAAERIFGILPEDQRDYMRDLWEEFEEGESAEARFAVTLDKMQPLLLNDATGGISWMEHGVSKEQVLKRNKDTRKGSVQLWDYAKELIERNTEKGTLRKEL